MGKKLHSVIVRTVAVADGDPVLCHWLATALTQSGFTCLGTVGTGTAAIDIVRRQKPLVILLDLHMPDLDGLEVTRQIVQFGSTAIVLLTSHSDPELPIKAMDLGANGFIQKPFKISQLNSTLGSALHEFQTHSRLEGRNEELQEKLETRILLEKAKGILMEQQHFSEPQAHRVMLKMSQDQGIPLKILCQSIIQVKSLLGKNTPQSRRTP